MGAISERWREEMVGAAAGTTQDCLRRLARLTGARGGKALWAITCCVLAEGGGPVQWSRRELARRTGFSEAGIDEALALGEAARILERRAGERAEGRGGVTPIVLALADEQPDTPRGGRPAGAAGAGVSAEHTPRRGVSGRRAGAAIRRPGAGDSRSPTSQLARAVDSTPDPDSTANTGRVESGRDGETERLIDELAARASEATGDAAPAMMRRQVARVVARLADDDWTTQAMAALVDEAVRRSRRQRQPARYCWRTLWQLVEEGWRPAHGMVRRPPGIPGGAPMGEVGAVGADARAADALGGAAVEAIDALASSGAFGLPSPVEAERPASLSSVTLATGTRLPVAALWTAILDDAARAAGAEREAQAWRWHPLVAVTEDTFRFDPPPGSRALPRRLHPHLVAALGRFLGRPTTLQIGSSLVYTEARP